MNVTRPTLVVPAIVVTLFAQSAFTALAQCANAREIAMAGNGATYARIGVDTQAEIPLLNNQTEVATFWESGNPANNAGGPHFGTPSTCPSATAGAAGPGTPWWRLGGAGPLQPPGARSIRMFVASPGCTLPTCPAPGASLSVLVEDVTAAGDDAAFVLYTADETPGPVRWWDLARTDPDAQPTQDVTHAMRAFPRVEVQASARNPYGFVTLSNRYRNVEINVWGVGPLGQTGQQIASYDIFARDASADPGRVRSAWGEPAQRIPFSDTPPGAPLFGTIEVACGTSFFGTYLAVGLTFDDGVPSYYVGRSVLVNCSPDIADPRVPAELRRAPARPAPRRDARR